MLLPSQVIDIIRQLSQRITKLEKLSQLAPSLTGMQHMLSDPLQALVMLGGRFGAGSAIHFGTVHECIPCARSYRVLCEGMAPIQCCRAGEIGGKPIGAADTSTLMPGTDVVFVKHPSASYGVILGVLPAIGLDPRNQLSDTIGQGTNNGFLLEQGYQKALATGPTENGGVIDFSSRSPANSLEIGEFCRTTETGLKIFLDPYLGTFQVDEATGLWLFYWDQLVRLSAVNFQQWTAGSELNSYDDEGEHLWYQGIAVYPWEQRGVLSRTGNGITTRGFEDTQYKKPWYAKSEPNYDDMQAFHRWQVYHGYLGQGYKKILTAPPQSDSFYRYADGEVQPQLFGLYEDSLTLHGHAVTRSVASISSIKRPVIITPKRKVPAEGPTGDTAQNYDNADHVCYPSPQLPSVSISKQGSAAVVRASGVLDLHSYLFNWASGHPFHYHSKDFSFPDESDVNPTYAQDPIPFTDLANYWSLPLPGYVDIVVDDRTGGTVRVYKNLSYITQLEDGGVIVGDGFGSQIIMTGGSVRVVAPGDIALHAGRDIIQWAGRDIVMRAKQSIDGSATDHDIRFMAGRNMQLVSAYADAGSNQRQGGTFIECRATDPYYNFQAPGQACNYSGIIFKAPQSEFVVLADSVYLRSDIPHGDGDGTDPGAGTRERSGDIVLDAGLGKKDVVTRSNYVKHFNHCGVAAIFGDDGGPDVTRCTIFTPSGSCIEGDTFINGNLANEGSHVLRNNLVCADGHVYSSHGGRVGTTSGTEASDAVDNGVSYETSLIAWGNEKYQESLENTWYVAGRPGLDAHIDRMWSSFRVQADYGTSDFWLMAAKWQREAGSSATLWVEGPLKMGYHGNTHPFPGTEKLTTDSAYYTQTETMTSTTTNKASDRPTAYLDPKYGTPSAGVLNSNYYVIG